jgi:hypothetical protein
VSPPIFYNIFTLLVIILIVYLAVLWIKKKKKNIFVHGLVLLICLLIAKPYLFSGTVSSGTFVFDQKQLFIATILPFMASLISWQTILFFQVLPFVLLLLSHTFFVVQRSRIKEYMIIVFFYIFFYAHIPVWIITDFITRKTILSAAVLGAFGCISICLLIYIFMKKRFNLLKTTIVYLFFSGLLLLSIVFLSWQKYVITPFETEAFRVVSIMKKNILIVTPKREPVYRAVAPLLVKDYKFGEQITSVSWNAITRPEGGFLEISDTESVIFVPEYLGAELYPEEKTKYHLKKIFDNGQISLYRR